MSEINLWQCGLGPPSKAKWQYSRWLPDLDLPSRRRAQLSEPSRAQTGRAQTSRAQTSQAAELSGCRVRPTLVGRGHRAINYFYCHPSFLIENKQEISTCLFFASWLSESLLCRDTLGQITQQKMTYVAREILPLRAQKHACGVTRLHWKLVLNPGYGGYVMHTGQLLSSYASFSAI